MSSSLSREIYLSEGGRAFGFRGGRIRVVSQRPVPIPTELLLEECPESPPQRALVAQDPGAVLTMALRVLWPDTELTLHELDAYEHQLSDAQLRRNDIRDVRHILSADIPSDPVDLVAMACGARGEALLTRELLEQSQQALTKDGRILVSTDGKPQWLRKAVKDVFGREDLQYHDRKRGSVVVSKRQRDTLRMPDHGHVLNIVVDDLELELRTRPGVFCHGRLDRGSKALMRAMDVEVGQSVLDLGCGAGVLGIAAAKRNGGAPVTMVDCGVRAVELAQENVDRNGFTNVEICLRPDLEDLPGGPYDRVLANPPYYSQGRIASAFTRAAVRNLAKGGICQMVAKAVAVHREILEPHFGKVTVDDVDGYGIFTARNPISVPPASASE